MLLQFALTLLTITSAKAFDIQQIDCKAERFRMIDEVLNPEGKVYNFEDFRDKIMYGEEYRKIPVVTVEVSKVPCAAKGCCTMTFSMRPHTTDIRVFNQVFLWSDFFQPIYQPLQLFPPEYILDGGANVGFATALFAMLYPEAQIISVEPDRSNFAIHNMNTHRFPNVRAVQAGLWETQTFVTLNGEEGEWGKTFKEVPSHEPGSIYGTTITALMKRFGFPRLDFAKIDIEGAEVKVFSDNADLSWLNQTRIMCTEYHDGMAHYYGREKTSDIPIEAMARRPFRQHQSYEHYYYIHRDVDKAMGQ